MLSRKTAYCAFSDFSNEARAIIEHQNINLTVNTTSNHPQGNELISILQNYDIIIIGIRSKLTADMLRYIKTPTIIATLSVGLDHIDKIFFESPLVTIINIKTANAISVAEHIFALILSLNKRIVESNKIVLEGRGHKSRLHERPEDIFGKTLGLVGCGNITKEVIKIAKVFNMNIQCHTKHPDAHYDILDQGIAFVSLQEVMQSSDIINVSIPLNSETKNLISKDIIKLTKPTATFINTSRAEIVDVKALIERADTYDTFYVGLDIDVDQYKELFSEYRDNVIVTPHTAGVSKQAIDRVDLELANQITSLINQTNR